MRKRSITFIIAITLCCIIACGLQTSCEKIKKDGRTTIISTVFPSFDFARQIIGNLSDKYNLLQLLPPGMESHAYEPSPKDIIAIQECDLFIYVGGESDSWVDKILNSMSNPPETIKLMECSTLVEEHEQEAHLHGEHKYDEHVWTSIANSISITEAICEKICEIDSENTEIYKENSAKYCTELMALQNEFTELFTETANKMLVFGDRFPMRYFVQEFGLDYIEAFPGCSGETEPDAATLAQIIDTIKEKNIKAVFYIEFSNKKVAKAIAEETGCQTKLFHSCHNVSQEELDNGATYISLMRQNLATLREVM